jgi:hypothetical protein
MVYQKQYHCLDPRDINKRSNVDIMNLIFGIVNLVK